MGAARARRAVRESAFTFNDLDPIQHDIHICINIAIGLQYDACARARACDVCVRQRERERERQRERLGG